MNPQRAERTFVSRGAPYAGLLVLCALVLAAISFFSNPRTAVPVWADVAQQDTEPTPAAQVIDSASVASTFTYQGTLWGADGRPANGVYTMTIAIYDQVTGGNQLFAETTPNVPVRNGNFAVVVGNTIPLSATIFATLPRFIGVTVGGDPEMAPRQRIHPVPMALTLAPGAFISDVNIGATTPISGAALDVIGSDTVGRNRNVAATFRTSHAAGVVIGSINGRGPYIGDDPGNGQSDGLYFLTNGKVQMRIIPDGNIQIHGSVFIDGRVSKAGGNFLIDHPLDPANKTLAHSFVESPDMMNVYNGNVTLDAEGVAWVTLPDWFEALNRDFRYQLTAIGAPGPNLYVAQEIAENRFQIKGGQPGAKVSWQVTGIRQDAWAKANPLVVEEEKPAEERGTYLHPDLYGQPAEKEQP